MTPKIETIAPDGLPFRMTHERISNGRGYRIVFECVPGLSLREQSRRHILADEQGNLVSFNAETFDICFKYVPGGQ